MALAIAPIDLQLAHNSYTLGGAMQTSLGLLAVVSMWALSAVIVPAARQQPQTLAISVNDPRPLEAAVALLEKHHGIVITYEDPPYLHASQISDVTNSVRAIPGLKVLVPRGGPFDFKYSTESTKSSEQMRGMLNRLAAEYGEKGYAGHFKVLQSGDEFHLVPRTQRTRRGTEEAFAAVLDTKVSMQVNDQSTLAALEAFVTTVTRASGVYVSTGTMPVSFFANTRVTIRALNEPARSVLVRMLTATGGRLSWQLHYGPEPPPHYMLNIHGVPPVEAF